MTQKDSKHRSYLVFGEYLWDDTSEYSFNFLKCVIVYNKQMTARYITIELWKHKEGFLYMEYISIFLKKENSKKLFEQYNSKTEF